MKEDDTPPIRLEKWLPYRMFIIAARVAELQSDYYGPRYNLSQASYRVLAVVGDKPGMSARQIRHAAGLDQFAVSRAIALLRDLGYVERNAADRDRRRAEVFLTDEGKVVFEDLSRVGKAIEDALIDAIPAGQVAQLDKVLTEIDKASAALASQGLRTIMPDIAPLTPKNSGRKTR
jgi:DNA-binding MarR family transcriptional regulator